MESYYLHPINAEIDNDIFSLPVNRLLDYFEKNLPHKEIVSIIDACHRDMSLYERGETLMEQSATLDMSQRIQHEQSINDKLIKALYGCGYLQASYEDDRLRHGVLSHFLIEKIREKGNECSFDEIAKELGEDVPKYVKNRFGKKQYPILFTPLTKKETWIGAENTSKFRVGNQDKDVSARFSLQDLKESGLVEEYASRYEVTTRGTSWFSFYESINNKFEITGQDQLRELVESEFAKIHPPETDIMDEDQLESKSVAVVNAKALTEEEKTKFLKAFGLSMKKIKGGTFEMGSYAGYKNEQPVHKVELDSFSMSKYPITFDQYAMFCKETENYNDYSAAGREGISANSVTWENAAKFCEWFEHKAWSHIQASY